jgi:hypothetical protein
MPGLAVAGLAGASGRSLSVAAAEIRRELVSRQVNAKRLAQLYRRYQRVPDVMRFVERALDMFPRLCCGLASVYLQHRLGEGVVVRGLYGSVPHTFLLVRGRVVIDVTADQFGGPAVYVGLLAAPWRQG